MQEKCAAGWAGAVIAAFAFLGMCCINVSSPQAACTITVDGVTKTTTLETSRTIQAAIEAFPYVPSSTDLPQPNSTTESCARHYFGGLPGMSFYWNKWVCRDGTWTWEVVSADRYWYEAVVVEYETGTWDVVCDCGQDSDCSEGYECMEGVCEPIPDNAPVIGDGPLVTSDWKVLPTSVESPRYINENTSVLWAFSDYASCSESCTHTAEYQALGDSTWIPLTVSTDPTGEWYAYVDLPIDQLQNATTYAFRFAVTDCASQTTQSQMYYFRVATTDAPPVIGDGPLLTDRWKVMPTSQSKAPVLNQNTGVLWTFSDDYATCGGLCTHRARYKRVDAVDWTWITVSTDPTGEWYAYATLPVESLEAGTYQFYFDVRDCAGQRTYAPKVYYFKVE